MEECRLRISENRILRRIFGPKRDENGEWRRLHNEELHSLYCSSNTVMLIKSRILGWVGHVPRMEEVRSASQILTGTRTEKRTLGKTRHRYEDTIRMDLKEICINTKNCVDRARIGIIGEHLVTEVLNHSFINHGVIWVRA